MPSPLALRTLLVVASWSAWSEPGRAQDLAPSAAEPQPSVDTADGAETELRIAAAPGQGLTVTVDDAFSLNLRSRIQVRYQLRVPPEDEAGERELEQLVNIGTLRLWLSGHVFQPELTYMIQLALAGRDYRDGATSPVFDAYLDFKAHRDLSVRVGQYFVPFDRLRTVREWALQMADRPQPVLELTLDRDVGVTLYSDTFLGDRSPLAWRASVFGGGGTNLSFGKEPGALLVGRLMLRPLGPIDDDREGDLQRRPDPALALGAAVARNANTNRVRSTTGATYRGGTTDFFHAATDLVFKWYGFALQAEYLWKKASDDEIVGADAMGEAVVEPTRSAHGFVLQGSYVFEPPIEVVARLTQMYAYEGTDPAFRAALAAFGQELGAGVNYYLNEHWFKLQADWIARMPRGGDFDRADHLVHVQLDATF
jgi:phosphate-selective porin OprO and OprP